MSPSGSWCVGAAARSPPPICRPPSRCAACQTTLHREKSRRRRRSRARRRSFDAMTQNRENFWSAVHVPFKSRDLTRQDLRSLIRLGLASTRGSYRSLVRLFNMPEEDYKRFLNFLRKHEAHLPIHEFRMMPVGQDGRPSASRHNGELRRPARAESGERSRRRLRRPRSGLPVRDLPVFLEWRLAIVLPQEVQKLLIVLGRHVEEPQHDLVVPARLLEPFAHELTQIRSS